MNYLKDLLKKILKEQEVKLTQIQSSLDNLEVEKDKAVAILNAVNTILEQLKELEVVPTQKKKVTNSLEDGIDWNKLKKMTMKQRLIHIASKSRDILNVDWTANQMWKRNITLAQSPSNISIYIYECIKELVRAGQLKRVSKGKYKLT